MNPSASRGKRILLCATLVALLGVVGYRAWQSFNPVTEKPQLATAVDAGDAAAQRALGRMYFLGEGGKPKDYARAIALFQAAAAQNNKSAQKDLGWAYANGVGVPKDLAIAAQWYEKAAAQGEPWAQNNLGQMYVEGDGVGKDVKRGTELVQKAAAQNIPEAEYYLGRRYFYGDEVPADAPRGVALLERSAAHGNAGAQGILGRAYETGGAVARDPAKAAAYYEKAVAQGDDYAETMFGEMLFTGSGVPRDPKRGAQLLVKSSGQGNLLAQYNLGVHYLMGAEGFPTDTAQGLQLLTDEKLVKSDLGTWSMYVRADYYMAPANPARDEQKAIALYRQAAAARLARAEVALGKLYLAGKGVPRDAKKAVDLFIDAAGQGDPEGCYQIGLATQNGTGGTPKDRVSAYYWFSFAAQIAGNEPTYAKAADAARAKLSPKELEAAKKLMEPEKGGAQDAK